jgi:hypothetical protein
MAADLRTDAERARDAWNLRHAVGTSVFAWPGTRPGRRLTTATRSAAWILGGTAVVAVDGYPGGIALVAVEIRDALDGAA